MCLYLARIAKTILQVVLFYDFEFQVVYERKACRNMFYMKIIVTLIPVS